MNLCLFFILLPEVSHYQISLVMALFFSCLPMALYSLLNIFFMVHKTFYHLSPMYKSSQTPSSSYLLSAFYPFLSLPWQKQLIFSAVFLFSLNWTKCYYPISFACSSISLGCLPFPVFNDQNPVFSPRLSLNIIYSLMLSVDLCQPCPREPLTLLHSYVCTC